MVSSVGDTGQNNRLDNIINQQPPALMDLSAIHTLFSEQCSSLLNLLPPKSENFSGFR